MSLFSSDGQTLFVGQPSPVIACASRAAAQSIANASPTVVQFDTQEFAFGHSTNVPVVSTSSYRVTVPTAGYYRLSASGGIDLVGGGVAGEALLSILVNGSAVATNRHAITSSLGASDSSYIARIVSLSASDYVQLLIYQSTGGARNTNTEADYRPRLIVELMR